jgi:2-polyprenyl-6-methoxyphenol hydroxylase-like FAD-dependent oxidoreductase
VGWRLRALFKVCLSFWRLGSRDDRTDIDVTRADVVVVGGGPAGLAASIELGSRGVSVLLLEPRSAVSMDRPRAKTTSVRTMEHLRRWGLADRLREVAPLPVAWSQDATFTTSLLGREITRFHGCLGLAPDRRDEFAESGQQVPQPLVEQILREALADYATVTFATGWSLESLKQSIDGVTISAVDATGASHTIEADYVLGCDGAASVTRHAVGVAFEGTTDGKPNFNMVFRAPGLASLVPHGPSVHYWVLDPNVPGLVGRMDLNDTWWAMAMGVSAERGNTDPIGLIRVLIGKGSDDIEIELVATDPWTARMLNATTYRVGRVFLVGDAAHLNPPWGGHGFNTAVGDAVNIGWKLAAVLAGWGGEELLRSYELERKPVAQQTIDLATRNMSNLSTNFANPLLDSDGREGDACRADVAEAIQATKHAEFHSLGLVLGYHYGPSPVTVDDGTPNPEHDTSVYTPSARPGSRLPHLWLDDGRSIYDILGTGFTLLVPDAAADGTSFVEAAERVGIPLIVVELHGRNDFFGASLVLVRPDQHLAWRSPLRNIDVTTAHDILRITTGSTP